jgi:hypothetical protein
MALGRREGSDQGMWIATNRLVRSPGHPFYERLNRVLGEAGFVVAVNQKCSCNLLSGTPRTLHLGGRRAHRPTIAAFRTLNSDTRSACNPYQICV